MKFFLLSAIVATVSADVQVDFDRLMKHSQVHYNEIDCGEWADYKCCANKNKCDKLKEGGDKKTSKKRIKERKEYCVHRDETCCGSDLHYNWKFQRRDEDTQKAVEHSHDKKKNVKACKSDEVCVHRDLLKHSEGAVEHGDHDQKFVIKTLVGKKSKTTCMKKDKFKKDAQKYSKKYSKKYKKEQKRSREEFIKNVRIESLQDHELQCGNFDPKVFKCCNPDKNFCDQIGAADKDKWCVKKDEICCVDFKYNKADRDIIALDIDADDETTWAKANACKKKSKADTCVYDKHDEATHSVTTKCVDKKMSSKNKKRGKFEKKEKDEGNSLFDILTGGQQQQQPVNPFLQFFG